jgi:hypothetical protein
MKKAVRMNRRLARHLTVLRPQLRELGQHELVILLLGHPHLPSRCGRDYKPILDRGKIVVVNDEIDPRLKASCACTGHEFSH